MDLKQIEQNYQSDMTCLHHKCEKCGDMRELDEFDLKDDKKICFKCKFFILRMDYNDLEQKYTRVSRDHYELEEKFYALDEAMMKIMTRLYKYNAKFNPDFCD